MARARQTYSASERATRPVPRDRGFTLLELLVTVTIIVALLGMGTAAYLGLQRNLKGEGALSRLESTLRQARNFAVGSRTFSQVRLDPKTGKVYAVGFKILGQWHFEDEKFTGAFGRNASVQGGSLDSRGKLGRCVRLEGTRGAHVELGSRYDFTGGGHIEAYFFPLRTGVDQMLFAKGRHVRLALDKEGLLHATVRKIHCSSGAYRLPPYRWSKVAIRWITHETNGTGLTTLVILVDDIERGRASGAGIVQTKKVLTISSPKLPFAGLIDEARALGAVHGASWQWPRDLVNAQARPAAAAIHFDQQGHLDSRFHAGPLTLTFVHQERTVYRLTIGMLGTIQQIDKSTYDPEKWRQQQAGKKSSGRKKKSGTPKKRRSK